MKQVHCCILAAFIVAVCAETLPKIRIHDGEVRGVFLTSRAGRKISGYMGIPYAQPPVGPLRFKNPVPVTPWNGVFEANNISAVCPQIEGENVIGTEDCLIVNVYTPQIPSRHSRKTYAVMVYIYGGSLTEGYSLDYKPDYLIDHDVILVTFNYRLGPLGFLSTLDEQSPGNYGLKDQQLVLKWVKKNIASFGGNPNSVTLFGQSSGGSSIDFQMCSKASKGLFHRAISISGSMFNQWAQIYRDSARKRAQTYAAGLNCPTENTRDLVECLRGKSVSELITKTDFALEFQQTDPITPFRPVVESDVEGAFLTADPTELFEKGLVADIPKIVGYTSDDGALRAALVLADADAMKELNTNREKNFPLTFMYDEETKANQHKLTVELGKKYFGEKPVDKSTTDELIKIYTDSTLMNGVEVYKQFHRKYSKSPLYQYYFNYRGTYSLTELIYPGNLGVTHFDDMLYLFPFPTNVFTNGTRSKTDNQMIDILTEMWTNFAKYGKPVTDDCGLDFSWSPLDATNKQILRIHSPSDIKMGRNPIQDRVDYWLNLPYNEKLHSKLEQIMTCHK